MSTYNLIITDITRYRDLFCVAGWDVDDGGMVRPEPSTTNPAIESSRFWGAQLAGPGKVFATGNVVRFKASGPPDSFPFPHAMEDRIVFGSSHPTLVSSLSQHQLVKAVAGSVYSSLEDIFEGHLVRQGNGKSYVPANIETNSLGAIKIDSDHLTFHEETTWKGKRQLRADIYQNGIRYDLSVPADSARARFLVGGANALQQDAKASKKIHVRIGLCRPSGDFADMCYAQVNGLYFL